MLRMFLRAVLLSLTLVFGLSQAWAAVEPAKAIGR